MGNGQTRDFVQVERFKLNLGLPMPKRYLWLAFDNKPIVCLPCELTSLKNPRYWYHFRCRRSTRYFLYSCNSYSFHSLPTPKGIDFWRYPCVMLVAKEHLPFVNANEYWHSTTFVISTNFFHTQSFPMQNTLSASRKFFTINSPI